MSENLLTEATDLDLTGSDAVEVPPVAPIPPKRGPGHRGQDIRDTMAEMAAKAHEISLEAGSKMASAMRDVIGAAAGISAFAIESARDLVNYMVRRGQMSQEEATKLLRDVEEAHATRPKEILKREETPAKKADAKTQRPIRMLADPPILVKTPPKPPATHSFKTAPKPAAKAEKSAKAGAEKTGKTSAEKAKAPAKAAAKTSSAAKSSTKKPAPKKK